MVKVLIQELPSLIKQRDSYSNLPLHYAASLGNLEMVRLLLQSDISTNYIMDKDGRSPFLVAANNGHVGVIKELLRFCPDSVEVADKRGRNVLHVAVESGKLEVMKYILKSDDLKELINEPDSEGNTPLLLAVIKRNVSVLNLLLKDKRVDMRAINNNGMTALDVAESDKELTMKFRKVRDFLFINILYFIACCVRNFLVGRPRKVYFYLHYIEHQYIFKRPRGAHF